QQGTIDGQENPIAVFESSKFSEVQKNILMWDGIQDTNIWLMSQKTLDKLPKKDVDIIKQSATEALNWGDEYLSQNEKELIKGLEEKGVKFTFLNEEEKQRFKDVSEKMVNSYGKIIGKDVVELFRNHEN
ncbi:MAG TPA: TRAP transporter substrate-binding protein DctP, partial [Candidatus Dorea intestinavium]|nr:TRAP transporter substrate-binding protein DctP [Candidatus Dorea intestinavium]